MKEKNKEYIAKIDAGMTYEEVRELAKSNGVKDKELAFLMRELDGVILQRDEDKADQQQAKEWIWVGLSFCLIAMIMLLYSFFDPESFYIYIVYGLFGGGALVFFAGWKKRNGQNNSKDEDA